jgi:PAS domain S-box-containing protein
MWAGTEARPTKKVFSRNQKPETRNHLETRNFHGNYMNPIILLLLSIICQVVAAAAAIRLIRLTGRVWSWFLIAGALVLMILRRVLTLVEGFWFGVSPLEFSTELVGLLVSLFLAVGISGIAPVFRAIQAAQESTRLNEARLAAVWELSQMTTATLAEITQYTLDAGVELTKSEVGFVGLISADEANLEILSWSKEVMAQCAVPEKLLIYPLATAGLWAEAVRRRQGLLVNDYSQVTEGKKGIPPGHIALRRLLVVPVVDDDRVVAVAAVANKVEPYDERDQRQLTLLLQGMWQHLRRQRSQQAMAHEIERMHQFQAKLIQTSNDGIIASDRDGKILIFNAGAEKIMGYRQEEVVGKMAVQNLYPPSEAHAVLTRLFSRAGGGRGRLINYETRVRSKTGELIPVELSATFLTEDHRVVAVVGFFRDLRERLLLQEKALQNERLAVLGRMAAHISHEIKNPLMVIGGFARQVRDDLTGAPEKNREKLNIIIDETKRLENFLVEVGRFTKFSDPRRQAGDFNALLRETAALLQPVLQENGITLAFDLAPDLPPALFDPEHLRQVVLNLMKNGIEAMAGGGELRLTTRAANGSIQAVIADSGPGIPPAVLAKVFQPFFSTKPRGSGLGLAICHQIMAAHGGEIRLESEAGRGTRAILVLPRA